MKKEQIKKGIVLALGRAFSVVFIIFLIKTLWLLLKFSLPIYGAMFAIKILGKVFSYIKRVINLRKSNRKMKKELIEEAKEKLEKNLEYTEKRLAGLRKLKGENGEVIYAEEYIPISSEDLENIQDRGTTINKSISEKLYQLLDFSQKLISIENNKIKLESEKKLLMLYSFQLQDTLSENNSYLSVSTEDLYENQENIEKEIQAIRTLVLKPKNRNFCKRSKK